MSAASILDDFSTYSGVLPVIAWLYNYKSLNKVLKIAGVFFLIAFLIDLILELMTMMKGVVNNMPLIHLFVVINILFFTAIYYYAFFKPSVKKAIILLAALALLIVVFNIIFVEGIWEYPSLSITVLSVLLICFSLAYFYQLLNRQEFIHIEKQGLFWINSGVLFYFAINIFLFMLFKQFSVEEKQEYYMIHSISNIIANILYTVGLFCKPQKIT
ncbi:hypothetical protein [Mucilaginibacter sp.]|uniref:hypothetical protein n=1 Tax=Mucilaginibacter sp. TaxID=1882438 RepID=UPI00283CFF19|nr:hypothetical protein [Mucilaginibacter sp.]MDR3694179.1 hypothetical protein [Mucilaginibacter sp.]